MFICLCTFLFFLSSKRADTPETTFTVVSRFLSRVFRTCLLNECLKKGGGSGQERRGCQMGAKKGMVNRSWRWRRPLVGSVQVGVQKPAAWLQDIRTRQFKVGRRGHREVAIILCQVFSKLANFWFPLIVWLTVNLLKSCQVGWGLSRLVSVQSIKVFRTLTDKQVWCPLYDSVNSTVLLSSCNHFLITLNSPLEFSASMWSQNTTWIMLFPLPASSVASSCLQEKVGLV